MLPLETERVRLRRLEARDAARLAEYRSESSVARYQSWDHMTLDDAHEFIGVQAIDLFARCDEWDQLAIADKWTDALIGDIGVCIRPTGQSAEIGFTMAPAAQGRGLATEACRAAIDLIFRAAGVMTIEAIIDSRNAPAIALVEHLGMSLDRTETAEFKGELCSEHRFVLER